MDEGSLAVDYMMPAGSSLSDTNRVVSHIVTLIHSVPEVASTARRSRQYLRGVEERSQPKDRPDYRRCSRETTAQETGIHIEVGQMLQDMMGDMRSLRPVMQALYASAAQLDGRVDVLTSATQPVDIKLFRENENLFRHWAPIVGPYIAKINGVVDVLNDIENTISGPAVSYQVKPGATAKAGFTPEEVETDSSAILQAETPSTPLVVNSRTYTIRIRFRSAIEVRFEAMNNTLFVKCCWNNGTLRSLAEIVDVAGQTESRVSQLKSRALLRLLQQLEAVGVGAG